MSAEADAVANQGEFSSRRPRDKPSKTGGHQTGRLVSEADRAPEFHAETLPAGTAPKESTFTLDPDLINQGIFQNASRTLQGADSAHVHTGLGHPGQGQTSTELRHGGQSGGRKQSLGNVGLTKVHDCNKPVDPSDPQFANQRNLEDGVGGKTTGLGGVATQD